MNRRSKLNVLLASTLLSLLLASASHAELITVRFEGTVIRVFVQNRPQLQGFDFPDVGDPFTGFYKFDSTALDTANSPEQGSFQTVLSESALKVSIGDFRFEGAASGIVAFRDLYGVDDWIPGIELISDPTLAQILNLRDFSLTVTGQSLFSNPNILPLAPPSLAGNVGSLSISMKNSLIFRRHSG